MGTAVQGDAVSHLCISGGLHYGITVFITLFKRLSQGFNTLGIHNILIKYAGASKSVSRA
jgi:hypothetical protein